MRASVNMKWLFVALLGLGFTCSCSTTPVKDEYKGPRAFTYQGDFYPSFMPSCTFVIKTNDGAGRIKLTVFNDRDSLRTALFADSSALDENDLRFFFTALDSVPLFKMATRESYGFDGITVYNVVSQDSLHNKFKFWSPRKKGNPQAHKLVEAVIGLSRRKFTSLKQQEYFESLEQYFDFGLYHAGSPAPSPSKCGFTAGYPPTKKRPSTSSSMTYPPLSPCSLT